MPKVASLAWETFLKVFHHKNLQKRVVNPNENCATIGQIHGHLILHSNGSGHYMSSIKQCIPGDCRNTQKIVVYY